MAQPSKELLDRIQQARARMAAADPAPQVQSPQPRPEPEPLLQRHYAAPPEPQPPEPEPEPTQPTQPVPDLADLQRQLSEAQVLLQRQNAEHEARQASIAEQLAMERKAAAEERAKAAELERLIRRNHRPTEDELREYFTEEQLTRLGTEGAAEMLMLQRKVASDISNTQLQDALKHSMTAAETAQKEARQARQDAFYAQVTGACPDWREIDQTVEFRQWLSSTDPVTGRTYWDLGRAAQHELDPERFVAVYRKYKQISAPPARTAERAPVAAVLPDSRSVVGVSSTMTGQQPKFTAEDVELMNRKLRSGFYKSRPAELAADKQRFLSASRQ